MQVLLAEIPGKTKLPHHRSDRQSLPNLNSPRCQCQDGHNTASTTYGPSNATKINTHLQHDTTLITFHHQQVSHYTTHNTVSSLETYLITDTVLDGHTEFNTTLQIVTSQGFKPLHVKVDPGTDCCIIPLSQLCTAFPKHFTKSGTLKKSALKPMDAMWSAHDRKLRHLLGYIVLNIQHKTTPKSYQSSFMFLKPLQI